jgi:putative NADH-flavin reductase
LAAVKEALVKFVILGATGGTGLEIVRQAVDRGHEVTAFLRSPDRLAPYWDRIKIVQGDLLNSAELERVIQGHDAVISGFGPRVPVSKADAHLLEQFAVALTMAMTRADVSRAVIESVSFLFKDSLLPPVYLLGRLFFPITVADAAAMERILQDSHLDWTLVRPPQLTNKPYTGKYRVLEGRLPRFGIKISRADVADFMVRSAENHASSRKIFGVSD